MIANAPSIPRATVAARAGKVTRLNASDQVLKVKTGMPLSTFAIVCRIAGIIAFTDGISEAMTRDEEEWGEDRMTAAAQQLISQPDRTYSAQQLLDCILAAADNFTEGAPQHDDMTLLVCTVS
jgi:serine phosphatase RsbU (regulator of sigma subunit)